MSSFQKVMNFFIEVNNDFLLQYLTAKKEFSDIDLYPKTAARDFFIR
jgi:hypothetical protein